MAKDRNSYFKIGWREVNMLGTCSPVQLFLCSWSYSKKTFRKNTQLRTTV